jgi:hypothetical protein
MAEEFQLGQGEIYMGWFAAKRGSKVATAAGSSSV